jgi:hypothetical protein
MKDSVPVPNQRKAWIVIAGFSALWLVLGWRIQDQAKSHDFLSFYSGAYLTSHGMASRLYDPAAQFALQKRLAPSNVELVPFIRPPFYAILLSPLGMLPFGAAFTCWSLVQIGVLVACFAWGWRRFGTVALMVGCMSVPAAIGIAHGQDAVLFLAVMIVSYTLAERKRDVAAGAVLGLLLVKFHLTPLWVVAMMLERRWKMLAGFAAAGVAAVGISLAMIGAGGVRTYAALLQNQDLRWLSPAPEFMISLQGLGANLGVTQVAAYAGGAAAVVALFLTGLRDAPLWRIYAVTTAASLLLVPHVYGYDAAMLLPGLWMATFRAELPHTRIPALWLCTPFPFVFALAGKPWAAASSLSVLAMLIVLAGEGLRLQSGRDARGRAGATAREYSGC